MVFKAKTDGFRWAIIGFVFLVYTGVGLLIYSTEGNTTSFYGLGSIWLMLSILIVWILPKTTRYTFHDDHLLCQSMGFKKRIPYHTLRSVEPANGFYAGWKMSTAWKCLVIHYNKYDELLISPENEEMFIQCFNAKKQRL
jgi:hypothetical protein